VKLYFNSPNTPSWRGAHISTGTTVPLHLPLLIKECVRRDKINTNIDGRSAMEGQITTKKSLTHRNRKDNDTLHKLELRYKPKG
jgi:hypothetical protein